MTNSTNSTWEQVRQFYKDKFNIEPELVDLMSEIEVLRLCATGAGNETISNYLDYDINYVSETIGKRFGLAGWVEDLPFSPLRVYKSLGESKDLEAFRDTLIIGYGYIDDLAVQTMYNASVIVSNMEKLLDENWN